MGDTYLRVLSFNTHLFGYTVESKIGEIAQERKHEKLIHDDEQRKHQLIHYLAQAPAMIDLFVLEEVWSAQFAHDFHADLGGTFPSFYATNDRHNEHLPVKDFNASGVILQAIKGATFSNYTYFDYITECNVDGFDPTQDLPSGKGFLSVAVELDSDFDSAITGGISFGLMGTHMITSQGTYQLSAQCCYKSLVSQIKTFANANQPSLLCGDFNVTEAANPVSYNAEGSLAASDVECSAFIYGVLLSGAPATTTEAFIYSRTAGETATPVTCYSYGDRFMFTAGDGPGAGGWEPSCVPFYVPTPGSGNAEIPIYEYVIAPADGSGDYFRLSPTENLQTSDPTMNGWTMGGTPAFYAVDSSQGVAIYEWSFPSSDSNPTLYAYFPEATTMPTGWTMATPPLFYAYGLLQSDPGYTVDSTTNTFWASVNSPYGDPPATPTQQRIDYIFQTNPAGAGTTFEFVEADVLVAEPALRIAGNEDISDHVPLFAIIKISDPSINSNGVVPVLCYGYGDRYLFSLGIEPRSGGWRLVCAPFFVPDDNTGSVPVYQYVIAPADGSGDYFRLSPIENLQTSDPTMNGWTMEGNPAFNAVDSSTPNSVPIYEWTLPGVNNNPALYAYFPTGSIMLPGWTMGAEPLFYGVLRGKLA